MTGDLSGDRSSKAEGPVNSDQAEGNSSAAFSESLWGSPLATPGQDMATHSNFVLADDLENYKVEGILGRGGFGMVYKARDTSLNRDVAIKVLSNPLNEGDLKLFKREAEVIAALSKHPAIVQIYQWGEHEGCPYFVMEYVAGSAAHQLDEAAQGLPVATALRIAADCADGLAYAHEQGVLHRDIKPGNILVEPDTGQAKLADFGLARQQALDERSITIGIGGSPPYMSPEQAEGGDVDGRSDVFSLGVTLYKLLCGRMPFEGDTPLEVLDHVRSDRKVHLSDRDVDLPEGIIDLAEKATAHKPEDRFQTAAEFAGHLRAALNAVEEGEEVPALPSARKARAARRVAVAASVVAALLAAVVVYTVLNGGSMDTAEAVTIAAAKEHMDQGLHAKAEALYRQVLARAPEHAEGLYGLGYALLQQAKPEEAQKAFDQVADKALKAEGQAALAFASEGEGARPVVEKARDDTSRAYVEALLARLDLLEENYEAVVERLDSIPADGFYFGWQHADALNTLGQAYYNLSNYQKAQGVFDHLSHLARPQNAAVLAAYIESTRRQLDISHRQEVRESANRIAKEIREGYTPPTADNYWTSRPLTFYVLPVESGRNRYAVESGLADMMPMLLGDELDGRTSMRLVDRELIHEILTEQELSSLVGSETGRVALGNVLGARVVLRCQFTKLGNKEKLAVRFVDVETSERIPVESIELTRQSEPEAIVTATADAIWTAARKAYPVQGRLFVRDGAPALNLGTDAGVEPGMTFDVLVDPEVKPLPDTLATVDEAVGTGISRVRVAGVDVAKLPDMPDEGLYVRERRQGSK